MKVLKKIKNIILGLLFAAFLVFAVAMSMLLLNYNKYGVTQFGDTSLIMVKAQMASENYKKGDLILVQSTVFDNIKENDEIFTYRVSSSGAVNIDVGEVQEKHRTENAITYKNGANYSMDFVIGKATKKYEKVGMYLSIIESKWGFFFMILIPCFIFFLWGIYSLIVEIKYGSDDDDEEEIKTKETKKIKKV